MIPNEFSIKIDIVSNNESIYTNSIDLSYMNNLSVDISKNNYPITIKIDSSIYEPVYDNTSSISDVFMMSMTNDSQFFITSTNENVSISEPIKGLDGIMVWYASVQAEGSQLLLRLSLDVTNLLMSSDIWLTY